MMLIGGRVMGEDAIMASCPHPCYAAKRYFWQGLWNMSPRLLLRRSSQQWQDGRWRCFPWNWIWGQVDSDMHNGQQIGRTEHVDSLKPSKRFVNVELTIQNFEHTMFWYMLCHSLTVLAIQSMSFHSKSPMCTQVVSKAQGAFVKTEARWQLPTRVENHAPVMSQFHSGVPIKGPENWNPSHEISQQLQYGIPFLISVSCDPMGYTYEGWCICQDEIVGCAIDSLEYDKNIAGPETVLPMKGMSSSSMFCCAKRMYGHVVRSTPSLFFLQMSCSFASAASQGPYKAGSAVGRVAGQHSGAGCKLCSLTVVVTRVVSCSWMKVIP